mmetsp:Transcript_22607/g.34149  ORF Transcript_22607/g.34149 Transcript_22607/m.34149 type:complete len:205 (+) Transcript_22607:123-737(+)|eukprot:CAMPEP_0178903010 /NCGR_PEP_ID=MMETSP0786-20121207/4923_1 /TAXON_ID=186022 /ORGANISM="Thalassionema frauenfeldii, Strain CCMP 1798" /LENGTH=204 /DNA_ID=CAMNT_0020574341 /DNA_START=54 /DNA_END=668 /DNA_ORIENTATION=+
MSLSFVSSAVLTSTDGVSHNQEKELESKELEAVRKNAGRTKSLFEQLRSNKEAEEEKEAEQRLAIMRGTMALDEEDVAHLNALERSKLETEERIKTELNQELALFRAAKEDRVAGQVIIEEETVPENNATKIKVLSDTKLKPTRPLVPKIVAKRKRKQPEDQEISNKVLKSAAEQHDKSETTTEKYVPLGGLLGGYGSSSDEDN